MASFVMGRVRSVALAGSILAGGVVLPGCDAVQVGQELVPPRGAAQQCTEQATEIANRILNESRNHEGPGFWRKTFPKEGTPTDRDKFLYLEEQERARCLREEALRAKKDEDAAARAAKSSRPVAESRTPPVETSVPSDTAPSAKASTGALKRDSFMGKPKPIEKSKTVETLGGFADRVMNGTPAQEARPPRR